MTLCKIVQFNERKKVTEKPNYVKILLETSEKSTDRRIENGIRALAAQK